jgi:hypothetical protein
MDSLTFTLTDAQMNAAVQKAAAQGIQLSPDGGNLPTAHGVVANYEVQKAEGGNLVTVQIHKKPFYVSLSMIQNAMREMLGV